MKLNPIKMPCKGCEFRHIGCHAECERYKAASEQIGAYHAEQLKSYQRLDNLNHINNDAFLKCQKSHRRKQ
jgi:hypothetical protein